MATEVLSFPVNLRANANECSPTYHKYYADDTQRDFDELFIERNQRGSYWIHFAVRPKGNRRKLRIMNG